MKFIVLDTNVLVSALISPMGKPAQIFKRCLDGTYTLCVDQRILNEYESVLRRPKFQFPSETVDRVLSFIRAYSVYIQAMPSDQPFIDSSDKKFFEVALSSNAILITGNIKYFPENPIVKTVDYLF